jgi:hypothetical protein
VAILTPDDNQACFNCGSPAHAIWHGEAGDVAVCLICATVVLPALIADTVVSAVGKAGPGMDPVKRWLETVQANYWRAASCAFSRLANEVKKNAL